MRLRFGVVFALLLAFDSAAIELSRVSHEPNEFDPSGGDTARVRFVLSDPARVEVQIHDGRGYQIRLISSGLLTAGDNHIDWDGRDFAGRLVPSEAYSYSIRATATDETTTWEGAAANDKFHSIQDLRWDPEAEKFHYSLRADSRVRIRIGLANNGPLLRTLLDWVPRAAGTREQAWDGLDASGALDLKDHAHLVFDAKAFPLASNVILIGPTADEVTLISDVPKETPRLASPKRRRRVYDYPYQSIESRRDFPLELSVGQKLARSSDGIPIVTGPLAVRLDVADERRAAVLSERCEVVFFVDGRYVFETEMGFLPMTWTWNPQGTKSGVHYITANLRGYEGHFGMSTLKVRVGGEENR